MHRPLWILLLCALCLGGCEKLAQLGGHAHSDEHRDEHDDHDHDHDHPDEVHLTAEAQELAEIRLGPVERRALTGGVAVPAEVQLDPSGTAQVSALSAGRITQVSVAVGARVQAGQKLGVVASSDVSTVRASLDQARARLTAAESTLRRQKQLASEGIGAQRAVVDAQAQVTALRAEVKGIQQQLSVFGSGRSGEIELKAPIAGLVVAVHSTVGETAAPDIPVFTVTDPSKIWVRGNVPELEIARAQLGMHAEVRLHAFPERSMRGTVHFIAPALDEPTRTLPIRVALEDPDPRLRSGLFGSIELIGEGKEERELAVPVEAVATLDGQTVVFVPGDEPHSFKAQPVALGRRVGAFYVVHGGLQEGDQIALSGAFTLRSALRKGELSDGHAH